ncbi:MAG: cysteine--tRNA ligase, partial [Oscillospiraceae bacterium]|nr:cysteine--tRNA ligase [Oscillospiraceae bacterium]
AALNNASGEAIDEEAFQALKAKFTAALDNDLNTSLAITALYDVLKYKTNDATKLAVLADFDQVLSLSLISKADAKREELKKAATATANTFTVIAEGGEDDAAITEQIMARQAAKKAKNYAEADRIRNELKEAGIEITDIPNGAKWKKI